MTRGSLIVVLVCAALAEFAWADNTEELALRVLERGGRKADLSIITPENKTPVVFLLREIATYKRTKIGTTLPSQVGAEIVLLRLADHETISRVVTKYQRSYGSRDSFNTAENLEWSAQGAIVPYLAEDFFRDDGDKSTIVRTGGEGTLVPPRSVVSAVTSLRMVHTSEQFSAETRAWAKQRLIKGYYPFDNLRNEMRLWWKQNEAAFTAGDYRAVHPPLVPAEASAPPPPTPATAPTPLPAPVSTPIVPPTPSTPPISTPADPVERKAPLWPWVIGGIVALLLSGTLVLKGRTGKPRS